MESLAQSVNFIGIEGAEKEETPFINGFNFPVDSTTLSGSKSQSQTYLDNTRISEGKYESGHKTKYRRKKKLSDRLNSYYQTKTRLSRLYDSIGNEKKAKQVFKCCSFVTLRTCGDHILGRAVNYRCFDRLCPECSNKRSNRLFYDYEPIVNEFIATYDKPLRPIHLVLTQMQKPNETMKESHQRIKKAFKKLVDRKFWKESFAGSLNSFEFTISSRTFADGAVHFHGHILAFCKLADKDRNKIWLNGFRQEWSAVSDGENKNLKLMPVTDLKNALREVLKYQVKPQSIENLTTERLSEVEGLHHSRMTSTSGDFHTFVADYRHRQKIASDNVEKEPQTAQKVLGDADHCPLCSKPLYDLPMPVKAAIIFIQQIENRLDLFGIPPS
jgi:hypothetical protein